MAEIQWTGVDDMMRALDRHRDNVMLAIKRIAEYWEPVLEEYAKENAPWTDRTTLARGGLHTFSRQVAQDTVELYLAHKMDYGKHLELKYQGRYAIILPTLRAHYGQITKMLRDVFG